MRIYAYTLAFDWGFAPNPFHRWCTLACCKPAIRRRAQRGDWIVGVTPQHLGNRLAYAMQVDESLSFAEYWEDKRFAAKRPRWTNGASAIEKCGDNCYQPADGGGLRQIPSGHWDHVNNRENPRGKATDLRGRRVVVGKRFCYFGRDAVAFPSNVDFKRPARFHRVNFTEREKTHLLRFLESLPQGIHGKPRQWPDGDNTWRRQRKKCG